MGKRKWIPKAEVEELVIGTIAIWQKYCKQQVEETYDDAIKVCEELSETRPTVGLDERDTALWNKAIATAVAAIKTRKLK